MLPWIGEFFSIYPRRNVEYRWIGKIINWNECEFVELDRVQHTGVMPVKFFYF